MTDSIRLTLENIEKISLSYGFNPVFMGKTVFFQDLTSLNILGYQVLSYRKRQIITEIDQLKQSLTRADRLRQIIPNKDYFVALIYKAKQSIYKHRIDLERSLESVIHRPIETDSITSLLIAWQIVMNGLGRSDQTGKQLKPINCLEKIRKVQIKTIDLLNDRFNN